MLIYGTPTQYALRALSHIVRKSNGRPCQASVIADGESIPRHFLLKLLHQLVKAKILTSSKGPGGGFSLAKNPKRIRVIDVVRVFEDIEGDLSACAIGWTKCSDEKPCSLHHEFKAMREQVRTYLTSVTLAAFVEAAESKE